jgi:hypothetical protein
LDFFFTSGFIHAGLRLQGAVYVKLEQATEAAAALLKLNGRWFDGQMIIAEHVPEEAYNLRFPNAPK